MASSPPSTPPFDKLVALSEQLRTECPWDQKQTIHSFAVHLREEVDEALRAVENNDADAFKAELGDILWNVLFLANIAREHGLFDLNGVLEQQRQKMVRRHPHVFEKQELTPEAVQNRWDNIKKQERHEKILQKKALKPIDVTLPRKTKAIIFDWDGVVADSFDFVRHMYQRLEKELDLKLIHDWNNLKHCLECDWKHAYLSKGYTLEDIKRAEALFKEEQKNYHLELFPALRMIIPTLASRFKLAIVSNNYSDWIKKKLCDDGLLRYFDEIVGVDMVSELKPNPAALVMCLQLLGVEPENTIYVGDMDGDIIAGKRAGVKTIAVTYGYHPPDRLAKTEPHHTVETPEELLEAIHQLH